MTPHVVVDVGNTRVKWGLCGSGTRRIVESVSLPADPPTWAEQLSQWRSVGLPTRAEWVLASVVPRCSEQLDGWLRDQGQVVHRLEKAAQLPLTVGLEKPDHVGIDRLLDAVAARAMVLPGQGAILVDAGSAVTVDWLDEAHVFRGGTIFPGLRLMTKALNDYTALLPLVTIPDPLPPLPGDSTSRAMQLGIFHALRGGIDRIVGRLTEQATAPPALFVTGGDAPLLFASAGGMDRPAGLEPRLWLEQTLAGILFSAEAW